MNWQRIKLYPRRKQSMWEGKDCEGRRIYTITDNWNDISQEPSGASFCYSMRNAELIARMDKRYAI